MMYMCLPSHISIIRILYHVWHVSATVKEVVPGTLFFTLNTILNSRSLSYKGSNTILELRVKSNSTLQNWLVKWVLSLTYKHLSRPSRKRCETSLRHSMQKLVKYTHIYFSVWLYVIVQVCHIWFQCISYVLATFIFLCGYTL
jgi:hypothetical protein